MGKDSAFQRLGARTEGAKAGCWDGDDIDHQPVLFFAQWQVALRDLTWQIAD